jgi:hypothetical protein
MYLQSLYYVVVCGIATNLNAKLFNFYYLAEQNSMFQSLLYKKDRQGTFNVIKCFVLVTSRTFTWKRDNNVIKHVGIRM